MSARVTSWLFDPAGLTPHGFCLLWKPGLLWTYAVSDTAIALAYFSIPIALAVFAHRRRDLGFRPLVWLFASFILLCGATHLLDVLTLWVPAYGVEALVKAATAAVSIVTTVALWQLLPEALALPAPAELQAANAALRESEARHRASFEQSPVPMYTLDRNLILTGVSHSFVALLGYPREEVLGRPVSALWASGSGVSVTGDREKLMAEGEVFDRERHYRCRDDRVIEALVSARLERRGGDTWIVCVIRDVTATRRAEEALRATEERLHQSQKMEAVGQLTGGIAHDFNNMLQAVGGSLELMERRIGQGRPEEAGRYVTAARHAVERATNLTHRMLAFARRQALQPTVVEPGALVTSIADLIRRSVGPTIQVEVTLRDGTWAALCDANQLESAVLNLALNARDAMPNGGRLLIATAERTLAAADLSRTHEGEPGCYVEIAVTDTGTGIDPETQARVFEPFFTTKPIGEGTGLGLSQTYGFVRQSGGFVRLESQLGHGTTVRLLLPRYQQIVPDGGAASISAPADQRAQSVVSDALNRQILVVEDETAVRALITDTLRDRGYAVMEADDGPSGLLSVQSLHHIDLLVTDVGLPGLNGRQLADAARAHRPGLPVLLITGYAGTTLDETKLAPGMEVMRKPFALEDLRARIDAMIETASA